MEWDENRDDLPEALQNSHRNGGRVFLIFMADPNGTVVPNVAARSLRVTSIVRSWQGRRHGCTLDATWLTGVRVMAGCRPVTQVSPAPVPRLGRRAPGQVRGANSRDGHPHRSGAGCRAVSCHRS